jgi:CDP-glucose 4,6-dehydratase
MTALLAYQGYKIHGFSDVARPNSLYHRAHLSKLMTSETFGDIRDSAELTDAISNSKADLVVHFAAQPIVLNGYKNARETFEVNIMGTLNTLEASLRAGCERVLVVTTDKVYKDLGEPRRYKEQDALQGLDPYSASKASADILAQSWLQLHREDIRVDVARGGNVIAGGDDSEFRLVPDIESSISLGTALSLRNSAQVRPWQHALDCIDGYLAIASRATSDVNTWNVGPATQDSSYTVGEFAKLYLASRESRVEVLEAQAEYKETAYLRLDSSQIFRELSWLPRWRSEQSINMTAEWHSRVQRGESPRDVTLDQVQKYLSTET